jgi:two-component system, OmpR family, response regulator
MPAYAVPFVAETGDERDVDAPGAGSRPDLHAVPGRDAPDSTGARSTAVLLVEDDPSMRMLCTVNLELSGFRVVAASTGAEAVVLAEAEGPFDVVLLDVMLPDLGGFDVAERLRASRSAAEVPVVFVSARVSPADVASGLAVGAIDYIPKPFDPIALADRLRDDLELFRRGGAETVQALRFGPAQDP